MKAFTTICFLLLSLGFLGCGENSKPPINEDFSCVKLYDDQGQDVGFYGCQVSDDWTMQGLTEEEVKYFQANDTVNLAGTMSVPITGVALFPNPVVQESAFGFRLNSPSPGTPVKLQLAIIDESRNVLQQFSLVVDCNSQISILAPASLYTKGKFYRVYYRVSAVNAPVLFEGHGNIVICKNPGNFNIETECL